MTNEASVAELVDLNERMIEAENSGAMPEAHVFFEGLLATAFAFRRASGEVLDRDGFLGALDSGGDRSLDRASEVQLLGTSRALVTCVVRMTVGGVSRRFDNARLFARDSEGNWRLLGWANERLS
jgi:hypothetical protein